VKLSVTIQSHPSRTELADELRARLGRGVTVTYDPEPEAPPCAWRSYREALDSTPDDVSHRLIVQDDIDPCPHFLTAVRSACRARPDDLLVFYVGGNATAHSSALFRASALGHSWAVLSHHQFVPVVAVAWPVGLVCPAVCWVAEQPWSESLLADDEIIGRWVRDNGVFPLASCPSLVEHRSALPSLMHERFLDSPGRRASCLIGPDCDARSIDWSLGPA
jgi:hypothetical protein